jgi:hypothetical protein
MLPRIKLNVLTCNRVYTFERTSVWERIGPGGRRDKALTESKREILERIQFMKRRKLTNRPLCLGDLILAVSSYSDSQEETAATVADLLASGQVTLMNNGRQVRARVR